MGVRGHHEVDARVRHQIGLELSEVDVQSPIEAEGSSQRRDDLADETVEVSVRGTLNVEAATAVCSRREWVASTALYGSTTAVDTWGRGTRRNRSWTSCRNRRKDAPEGGSQ